MGLDLTHIEVWIATLFRAVKVTLVVPELAVDAFFLESDGGGVSIGVVREGSYICPLRDRSDLEN
jgi:hypothetical protein